MATENLVTIGILVILIGFVLVLVGTVFQPTKTKAGGGFIAFIGPIPIGWATSKNVFYILVALSLFALIIFLLINRRLMV